MDQAYQQVIDQVTKLAEADAEKDQLIARLQHQPVAIYNIQAVMPETLWYEARDASAPKTGPHGSVTISPGNPATVDFHPIRLDGVHSDNCYNLRRLYPTLTQDQQARLETAREFSVSCDYLLDPLASVQAAELDCQVRRSSGVVINIGPQLLPVAGAWIIRGFDYVKKVWVPLGAKTSPVAGKPIHLEVWATCDDRVVQFTKVVVDGVTTPTTFSHPVSLSSAGQPYLNAAYQLDATADGKAYRASLSNFQVTYA